MILGDTVAQIAFRLNGKHLGRFAVAAVFLLCFFASVTWGACTTYTSYIGVNAGKSCTSTPRNGRKKTQEEHGSNGKPTKVFSV